MADLIISNGRLISFASRPQAEALAIRDGRILAIGSNAEIAELRRRETREIDAGGASVLPGFIDAHVHLFMGAAELDQPNLAAIQSEETLTRMIRAHAAAHPDDPVIFASGATDAPLGGAPITRAALDRALPDRPLAIMGADHHVVWANTAALALADLLDNPGGMVIAGPDGRASGELLEASAFAPLLALTPLGGAKFLAVRREVTRSRQPHPISAGMIERFSQPVSAMRHRTVSPRSTIWTAISTSLNCWRKSRPRAICSPACRCLFI